MPVNDDNKARLTFFKEEDKLMIDLEIDYGDDEDKVPFHSLLAAAIAAKYKDHQACNEVVEWFLNAQFEDGVNVQVPSNVSN